MPTLLAYTRPVQLAGLCSVVPSCILVIEVEIERMSWDPKDGELCLNRTKPEETLVEVRNGSDVQIDRQIWV